VRPSGIVRKKRVLIALCTAVAGLVGALAVVVPSQAAPVAGLVPLAASAAPRVPAGATRLGALAAGTTMHVDVTLNVPDQAALTAFLNGVTDPSSPYYHKFLGAGQFGPRFGPSLAQVAAVEDALRAAGLSPGPASSDRLDIPVTATASALERGFGVTLDRYRMAGGRVAYASSAAPKIPAAIAPLVQGVLGLDDLYPMQVAGGSPATAGPAKSSTVGSVAKVTGVVPDAKGPQPCSNTGGAENTADVFAAYYGMNALYSLGDLGQGQKIAVVEFEPNATTDITKYEQCYGISTKVNYFKVDGGAGTGTGTGEAALDIEVIAGLAPRATIDVYRAPPTQLGGYDIWQRFTKNDIEKTLSMSWGSCETRLSAATLNANETQAQKAAAQGQTILASAGDSGSTGCFDSDNTKVLSASSPSILPYVTGVGGTSFGGKNGTENVWNDSDSGNGAGGGGVSSHFCMPAYQHQKGIGVANGDSKKDASASCQSKLFREGPDISADADPNFGYVIFFQGSWQDGIGGTSASAPLWASIAALTNASPFCADEGSGSPGVLPQVLYKVAAARPGYIYASKPQGLRDITSGNNDYTPSGYIGGRYPAAKRFDMATGLGAPMVSGLSANGKNWDTFVAGYTALACHAQAKKLISPKVTSVSPRTVKAGHTVKVSVHGSGFLPISGADQARIMSGSKVLATVNAACGKATCTLTMPAESARTVDIKIYAQNLWSSPISKADHFIYNKA
jgi:subtilase family serine protease